MTGQVAEVVDLPAQWAVVVRRIVAMAAMPQVQREARALLDHLTPHADVCAFGRRLTVWRMPQGGLIDYAPGVLVGQPIELSGEPTLFQLPAGRTAHVVMTGGWEGLPTAWGRLFADCASNGWALAGLNWEIYGDATDGAPATADLYAALL